MVKIDGEKDENGENSEIQTFAIRSVYPVYPFVCISLYHHENPYIPYRMSPSWSMPVAGEVFDAAAREFLRVFLRSLAAAVAQGGLASSVPWAEI